MDDEDEIKIVLLGQTSVGKTCIVNYFIVRRFDDSVSPTLGASFASKTFDIGDDQITLQIWDTAGQERFKVLAPMYYRGSHAALLVYSITDQSSFSEIDYWINNLRENTDGNVQIFLIGNKTDLNEQRAIKEEEGQEKATLLGATFIETSAVNGNGIDELFIMVAKKCFEQIEKDNKSKNDTAKQGNIDMHESKEKKTKKCC
ncbi:Ras-like GTP-binding protein RYL1 [Tritrichomonas foetus]|uniref:Ras-like GTP-binding protein RYL1 n=1 Tax=Tritrichomonas foetus TaxID=1144522 RepID=A0A1J4KKD0_9EUKA|nr:Ras-like GTP-binding protein RYL1 [Tritrichomonas foetus]|eukprot:OHT11586.1 Ras-like GTP-binding protein RYL1 [Tritrichomonas foetus]